MTDSKSCATHNSSSLKAGLAAQKVIRKKPVSPRLTDASGITMLYFFEIEKIPLLTVDQELALARGVGKAVPALEREVLTLEIVFNPD